MINKAFSIQLNKGYIMAVEDSMVQARMLKHFFEINQIESVIYSNASDAYEAALNDAPVLILSDIVMPGMDGYAFCTKIKQNPALCDIPVILLTSLSDPLDIVKGLQAGADNFITKPYDEQYLLARIHYLLINNDMRKSGSGDMVIDIVFQGEKYKINSDKKQILNLLLSVYEAAIHRNNELLEAQHQLQILNENLRATNEELDAFARTVSHDLKSPLVGVSGFTEMLIQDYKDVLDQTGLEYLDFILKSADKMRALISDLLNYSRSSRASIQPQKIDIGAMANEIVNDLKMQYQDRSFQLKILEYAHVFADPALIKIVLNNLLGNAFKYSEKRETPSIEFGESNIYGNAVYYVKDNGAGFDMEKAAQLFTPFVRLHKDSEFVGTGVGLSTVKRIIERHNGEIWAESKLNEGSTFYFTLGLSS